MNFILQLFYECLNAIVLLIAIVLPIFFYITNRKFLKGEIYEIMKWLFYLSFFVSLCKVSEDIARFLPNNMELAKSIDFSAYIFFFLIVFALFRIALLVYSFANTYGFADFQKKKLFGGRK